MKQPLIILTGPRRRERRRFLWPWPNASAVRSSAPIPCRSTAIWTWALPKVTKEEMDGIPHYLIDVLDPEEAFNVVVFQDMAKKAMKRIRENGHIPIVAGGTGFYIQALLYDIDFTENDGDMEYRHRLEALAEKEGPARSSIRC